MSQPTFDKFIPHYFTVWKGRSLDSYDFKSTLLDFFNSTTYPDEHSILTTKVDWDTWFYTPGLPPWTPKYSTKLVDPALKLAEEWRKFIDTPEGQDPNFGPVWTDVDGWSANQLVVFLEAVLNFPKPLPAPHANYMGMIYSLNSSKNVEVLSRYYQVEMKAGDWNIHVAVTELLGKVGRMKFVRPLYRGLIKMGAVDIARECFERNKDFYHPICRAMIVREIMGKQ